MPALPNAIHKRLSKEFRLAASKLAKADSIEGKLYFFSVFYGETGRQLNMHWDPDLALLFQVVQGACAQIGNRVKLPPDAGFPPDGIWDELLQALDQVSEELATAFEAREIEVPRLYAALARTAELTYITTGNGAYLYQKGMIQL